LTALALVPALIGAVPAWADRGPADLAAYARARAAEGNGQVEVAVAGYAAALNSAPDNVTIARRAYREALKAGDDALVDRAIAVMNATDAAPADAALLSYAGAIHAGDKAAAKAALTRISGGPFAFTTGILAAWTIFDAGGDPLKALDGGKINPVARRYSAENHALLLIATGKIDEGMTTLQALLTVDQSSFDLRFTAAELLAAKGKPDLARALLVGRDPAIRDLRKALDQKITLSSAFGISRLFTRLAADLSDGDPSPLNISLARAALRLEPDNDRARILLAQALSRSGVHDRALATLDRIAPTSPFHELALRARVSALRSAGDDDAALAAATALSARKEASSNDAARVGDLLVAAERFPEAAQAYRTAIERSGEAPSWTLYLQLGGALDEAGRWPEARKALERAVAVAPNAAFALNYLGYARLEHGEDAPTSVAILERASALEPDNASIIDSLAWAYFRNGEPGRALPMLERAARSQADNATINEHLGDAYWAVGRRYEARYAWTAASATAETDDAARLAGKIAHGIRATP
jgi:tetratricopeptide (TPR) repeat protein